MEPQIKPCFVRLVRLAETKLKKQLKCPVCPKTWSKPSQVNAHLRFHTNERDFGCEVCNQKFKTKAHVRQHSKVHSDQRPNSSCLWCCKCFKTNESLMIHIRGHTKETPYYCEKCPASFAMLSGLIQHKNVKHDFGNGKKCEHCDKIFRWPSKLKEHLRVHTGEKPFSCSVCGSLFSRKADLTRHFKIHSGSRPFCCSKCPSQFTRSSNLKDHVRWVHSNVRPYKCEICGHAFTRKDVRDKHTNSHFNEKHHRCQTCGKRFARSDGLLNHRKAIHDNIRSFKCSKCSKAFVNRSHLQLHFLRIHSNPSERLFHCIFCPKTYCLQEQFNDHVRNHLSEKPYFCNLCNFSSGLQSGLKRHILRVHQLQPAIQN